MSSASKIEVNWAFITIDSQSTTYRQEKTVVMSFERRWLNGNDDVGFAHLSQKFKGQANNHIKNSPSIVSLKAPAQPACFATIFSKSA